MNYAIALTDLPVFHKKCVVIADADIEDKIAQISLPAFGLTPTVKNVKYTLIHMIKELYYRNTYIKEGAQLVKRGIGVKDNSVQSGFFNKFKKAFRFATIKRVEFGEKRHGISVRFLIHPTWSGLPIILSGMTIANQPWSIMPSFKKVVGLAFATGSYMLVFNTLWKLSALYGIFRLVLVMVLAIGAMTAWTIFAHSLWEKRSTNNNTNGLRYIYNTSTILTLLIAIILFYISIFILFLFAVVIFVPPDMFEEVIDKEVGIGNYLSLVWLVSSAATVAGAIGAGLENAEEVRQAPMVIGSTSVPKPLKNKKRRMKHIKKADHYGYFSIFVVTEINEAGT